MTLNALMSTIMLTVAALTAPSSAAAAPVQTADVTRFFQVFDSAGGKPGAATLQRDYLDQGTPGLKRFATLRRISGESIAAAIASNPSLYTDARECAKKLPAAARRVSAAVARLRTISPSVEFPVVTVAVGRGRPVGTAEPAGAYIGLEALCAWRLPDPNVEDRMFRVIVHELVHTRQTGLAEHSESPTVLHAAIVEGAAEFLTELLTGSIAYRNLQTAALGRERAIEEGFLRDIDKPASGSAWVFNAQSLSDQSADLGYWVGYRIAKSYWMQAPDKAQAIVDILAVDDAHLFLAQSGWAPGMELQK